MSSKPARVTYGDMWRDALDRADHAADLLAAFARLEDALEPVDPEHVAAAETKLAIARGQANLIAWCERNQDYVRQSLAKEAADLAAKEAAAAAAAEQTRGEAA